MYGFFAAIVLLVARVTAAQHAPALFTRSLSGQRPTPAVSHWRLQAELRVGVKESGAPYEFTEISQVVPTAEAVFVRQTEQQEIRVFDAAGIFRRTIGRRGGGPGEFQGLWAFGIYADTLWTLDFALRRVTLFAMNGKLLKTVTFDAVPPTLGSRGNYFATYPVARQRDGILLGFGGTSGQAMAAGLVKATPLLRMSPSGRTTDTLGWLSITHENMILRSPKGTSYRVQPFNDAPLTAYAAAQRRIFVVDRRAAVSRGASYGVVALKSEGDTAWSKRFEYTPVPMDRRVADSVRKVMHRAYGSRYPITMIDDSLFLPRFQSPVSEAFAGEDGTLWLRREGLVTKARYDVLDASGVLRARVEAGRSVRLRWVSGTTAWGQELDQNDVPTLVRYRVVRATTR